ARRAPGSRDVRSCCASQRHAFAAGRTDLARVLREQWGVTMHPSIDHTILSPSGRVSKRARKAALEREAARLFPPGTFAPPVKSADDVMRDQIAALRRSAMNLRDLAARGM